jgi:hypothetical protein
MSLAAATPPEAPPHARRTAESAAVVLLAVFGFAVALAAASHLALVHSRPFLAFCRREGSAATQPLRIEATLRALRPGEAQLIAVGSSVLDSDLDVDRLARRYHLDLRPLPLYGGTTAEMAMLTPRLSSARPEAVVLFTTVWMLFDHVDWPEVRLYDPRIAASLLTWRELVADRQAHASHLLGWFHFVIRHRAALRERLAEAAEARFAPPEQAGGRHRITRIPAAVQARWEAEKQDFTCRSVNARALEIMAGRLRDEDVPLVVVPTPANSVWDGDESLGRRLEDCLAGIAGRTEAIVVPRPPAGDFPPSAFQDRQHMNAAGRQRFTDRVGPLLQQALVRARSRRAVQ